MSDEPLGHTPAELGRARVHAQRALEATESATERLDLSMLSLASLERLARLVARLERSLLAEVRTRESQE